MSADLRTLAAEALLAAWRQTDTILAQPLSTELADAVLAAVLPEHRRMVLGETADVLRHSADGTWSDPMIRRGVQYAHSMVVMLVRESAAATPQTGPALDPWETRAAATGGGPCSDCGRPFWTHVCLGCSPDHQTPGPGCINCRKTGMDQTPCKPSPSGLSATVPAGTAPAVPEGYPFAQIGRQAVESVLAFADALGKAYGPALAAIQRGLSPAVPQEADGQRAAHSDALTYAEMEAERERLAAKLDLVCDILTATQADRDRLAAQVEQVRKLRERLARAPAPMVPPFGAGRTSALMDVLDYLDEALGAAAVDALPDFEPADSPSPAPKATPKDDAGRVPLADVLHAMRDEDAMDRFAQRHGDDLDGWYVEHIHRDRIALYLAERFATAPEGADERNGHG